MLQMVLPTAMLWYIGVRTVRLYLKAIGAALHHTLRLYIGAALHHTFKALYWSGSTSHYKALLERLCTTTRRRALYRSGSAPHL